MCVFVCVCLCVYNNCAVTWDDAVYTHVVVEVACMVSLDTEERVGGAEATGGGRGGWRGSWSGQEKLCVFERERERERERAREEMGRFGVWLHEYERARGRGRAE